MEKQYKEMLDLIINSNVGTGDEISRWTRVYENDEWPTSAKEYVKIRDLDIPILTKQVNILTGKLNNALSKITKLQERIKLLEEDNLGKKHLIDALATENGRIKRKLKKGGGK